VKKRLWSAALAVVALGGCSTTPYQASVATVKSSMDAFTTAQASYSATYAAVKAGTANSVNAILLQGGAPVLVDDACVGSAEAALSAAKSSIGSNGLDTLYDKAAGGAMAEPKTCAVSLRPERKDTKPAEPAVATAAKTATSASKYDPESAEKEAAADVVACKRLREVDLPPPANLKGAAEAEAVAGVDAYIKAINAYVAGLSDLTSADNSTKLSTATSGAATAIGSLDTKDKAFSPAINLLFVLFDKAVEQKRYSALKRIVLCANPVIIRSRGAVRDAMRYEQIASFEVASRTFAGDAKELQAVFDAAPAADCPPLAPRASLAAVAEPTVNTHRARRGKRGVKPAVEAPPAAPTPTLAASNGPIPRNCVLTWALARAQDPHATPDDLFQAYAYLQNRAGQLGPRLQSVQAEAQAARALAAADPGPAVDALIQAHRALRKAIVDGKGQFAALQAAASDLNKASTALETALAPAKAVTSKKAG
jgi:hypothetical protein